MHSQVSFTLLSLICVFFSFFFHLCKSRHHSRKSNNFKPTRKTCTSVSVVSNGALPTPFLKPEPGADEIHLKVPSSLRHMHFSQHLFCLPICPNHSPEGPLKSSVLCARSTPSTCPAKRDDGCKSGGGSVIGTQTCQIPETEYT